MRLELVDAATPFGERIRTGFRYPLRGSAPLAIVAITLFEILAFFPGARLLITGLGWVAIYAYAFECLRRSADGYADPPEVALESQDRTGFALVVIQVTGNAIAVLAPILLGIPGLLVSIAFAFVLPAITMSLTFDGVLTALNPATWIAVIGRLGSHYMALFGVVAFTSLLQSGAQYAMNDRGPSFLGMLAYFAIANYLTVYNFHLMGALIHHRHETLGYRPESEELVEAFHQDDDTALLKHVNDVARDDIPAATDILTDRIRDGIAPAPIHLRYRELLRSQQRQQELLVHAQIWIAALVVARENRRALGVVQDTLDIDPAFLPDAPTTCGPLAEAAAHGGMIRLAAHLSAGYLRTWPGDAGAPHYGLLAARLLERLDRVDDALALARALLHDYPEHPLVPDIADLLDHLATGTLP
ncbi:MAG: hypothetical protein GAK28_02505 [Luteibacter sp.]|uniref:hypothetical protein n=1 Tax=Luteibacter sp. TaxID=1886636 RepID=UPI001385C941|nr:hypothetical protein [Luteibacter sp.]KAF1006487.1 MAG: hypothetical protein GAK28_02505 [Luteibacter sp.]